MAEYAVMPKADYQDACNAVREKTGDTGVIKSGDMGAQIRAIDTQEDLSAEMSAQDNLITQIAAALEGKTAGGSSAPETAIVRLTSFLGASHEVWYMDAAGIQESNHTVTSFTCIAPSILGMKHGNGTIKTTGSVTLLNKGIQLCIFSVTGDGTITITSNAGSD